MRSEFEDTRAIERDVGHRPWPLPALPWVMFQSWRELLFAHWPVAPAALRPLVPAPLEVEEHGGSAWVGLTPFRVSGLRARGLPALPGVSEFPEANLRTYVRHQDRPGIYFFSLDAASRLAVWGARAGYRLPYRHARMRVERREGWIHYRSRRDDGSAELRCRYRPSGPVFRARPGTLEHFLTERYALYVVLRNGGVIRGDIHHRPWPLQAAEAVFERNAVAEAEGVPLPGAEPILHYAERQDTLVWPPQLVSA